MSLLLSLTCTTVTALALPWGCFCQNLLSSGIHDSADFFWNCHSEALTSSKQNKTQAVPPPNRIHFLSWIAMEIWTFIFCLKSFMWGAQKVGLKLGRKEVNLICLLSANWLELRGHLTPLPFQDASETYSWGNVISCQVFWDSILSRLQRHYLLFTACVCVL